MGLPALPKIRQGLSINEFPIPRDIALSRPREREDVFKYRRRGASENEKECDYFMPWKSPDQLHNRPNGGLWGRLHGQGLLANLHVHQL